MIRILSVFLLVPLAGVSQKKQDWIKETKEQWPQVALVNNVQFKNGDRYIAPSFSYAGTGFLIDTGADTLAATAKHVLWVARNKKSTTVQINDELLSWTMAPKGVATDSAVIDKLLNEDSTEILEGPESTILERDWLVFSLRRVPTGIQPLKPRYSAVKTGEVVYVLSCAYNDSICKIYEGKVYKKLGMDILIQPDAKQPPAGSSGSAVVDVNGYLIGIISSYTNDSKVNGTVAVAVSTEYLYMVLNKKKGLNTPKKNYADLLLQTVISSGPKAAIKQYSSLIKNPQNYYIYNLRSTNKNGLRETGEKLIEMNRLRDAIEILQFNTAVNDKFYVDYNLLAKACLLAGDRERAIKNYEISISKFNDKDENEAFKQLEQLRSN